MRVHDEEMIEPMAVAGLAPYCHEKLFLPDLKARDKDAAIAEMVDHLVASGRVKAREVILNTIRERERIWPTAIGRGVAVPHGRSLVVPELAILFARSSAGIDFGAEDHEPVRLVFLILAPYQDKENRYLPALGKLVELVADEATRQRLLAVTRFSEFMRIIEGAPA